MGCRSCDRVSPTVFKVIPCFNPVLTIGFPPICPGFNTVTLANGAVVDLNQLGDIVSKLCPSVACPTNLIFAPTLGTFLDP